MINSILDISEGQLRKFLSSPITIKEKMDLIYFKLKISNIVSVERPVITNVDKICNSIYHDILYFAKNIETNYADMIRKTAGNCSIGFFYAPVPQTKVIEYPEYNNRFIISDVDSKNDVNISEIENILPPIADKAPIIGTYLYTDNEINDILDCFSSTISGNLFIDRIKLANMLLRRDLPYSGIPLDKIEGIILSSGNKKYKLIINDADPKIGKTETKMYRDSVISNFIHTVLVDKAYIDNVIDSESDYISVITKFFIKYMDATDIFKRLDIEEKDLLPPHIGYIGDFDIEAISDNTAKIICKYNPVAKNVLRMLLHTFNNTNINKFKDFSKRDIYLVQYLLENLKKIFPA